MLTIRTLFALLILSGCASGPTYDEYAGTMQPISGGHGRIYFYRLTESGTELRPAVRVDREVVGRARPDRFFYVDLPPGDYDISASKYTKRILSVDVEASEEIYVRIDVKFGQSSWYFMPRLIDAETGKKELQQTIYTGDQD